MLGTVQNDKLSETENIIEKNWTFFAFFLYLPSVSVTPHWQTPQKKNIPQAKNRSAVSDPLQRHSKQQTEWGFNLSGSISHQAVARCFYTSTFRPQSLFTRPIRSCDLDGSYHLVVKSDPSVGYQTCWDIQRGARQRFPLQLCEMELPRTFCQSDGEAGMKRNPPGMADMSAGSQGAVIIVHVTWHLRPLRNASHLLKHASLAVCKVREGGQFHRVMFYKVLLFFFFFFFQICVPEFLSCENSRTYPTETQALTAPLGFA